MTRPLVVAVTGASGVVYGVELLKALRALGRESHLIVTESAARNLAIETDLGLDALKAMADVVYSNRDLGAAVASGSFLTGGMAVVPCTIKSLSAIAHSHCDSLVARAADVTLKERRRLVLVVRETPLHRGHLDLMARCCDLGATVLPPMPAFYHHPRTIQDIIDHTVGKVLDQFDIAHDLYRRWDGSPAPG